MCPTDSIDEPPLLCARCVCQLHPGQGDFYVVRIDAVADPSPPEFSEEDLRADHREEIAKLLAQLDDCSPQELRDQVYRRLVLHLCNRCFGQWIENPTQS